MHTHIDNIHLLAADYTSFALQRNPLYYKHTVFILSVVLSHIPGIYENTQHME
jgi:hypothetical protein